MIRTSAAWKVAPMQQFDVVVLGAGAAGLMCAIEAGRRQRRVLVLDHAEAIGKKILISGGGRCNFTNTGCTAENFLSENPHFARSALARYTPHDFIALVEAHNIPYHEKTLGQQFCDRSSRDIVAMLERECAEARVRIQVGTRIAGVRPHEGGGFSIETSAGLLRAESVVVATGGLSIPKMGATGFGYQLARQFGLRVVEPRPALVPFTFAPQDHAAWCDLAGVSAEVIASRGKTSFREKLLITHRGVSGPAVLQISSYWQPGEAVIFDLAPDREVFTAMLGPQAPRDSAAALTNLRTALAGRWAERWLARNAPPVRVLSNAAIATLEQHIHAWRITPAGTEGFAKAEVTAGGVSTAELDARTLEARKVPGLFFIGEVVDVTGWLGGYNFQWAWASGFCAGQAA
jgi:predicted Rossmann fold flavoprotein